jgi:Fe2+-dicitrate sensor, membrane component
MTINRKHIDRIFSQKFSLLDQKIVQTYFSDEELNEEAKEVLEDQWDGFIVTDQSGDKLDQVFYKLYYQLNSQEENKHKKSRVTLWISSVAAILVVGLLLAASIYFTHQTTSSSANQIVEFYSTSGFRNQFRLPDGTSGWLGYGSKIKYHTEGTQRVVELDGLAFFDVSHQPDHPFWVNTPTQLKIKVLGTKFNVCAYKGDKTSEVVLEQGRVQLNINDQEVGAMHPNERILYKSADNTIKKSDVNVVDFTAWKDGKLILNDISLDEAGQKLSRFYNVDFIQKAKIISSPKIRLVLENESIEEALELLTMITPYKFDIENRKILNDGNYIKRKVIINNK